MSTISLTEDDAAFVTYLLGDSGVKLKTALQYIWDYKYEHKHGPTTSPLATAVRRI